MSRWIKGAWGWLGTCGSLIWRDSSSSDRPWCSLLSHTSLQLGSKEKACWCQVIQLMVLIAALPPYVSLVNDNLLAWFSFYFWHPAPVPLKKIVFFYYLPHFFNMQHCNRRPTVVNFILSMFDTLVLLCGGDLAIFHCNGCFGFVFVWLLSFIHPWIEKYIVYKWINIYDGERDDFFISCTFFRSLTFNLVIHLHQTDVDVDMFRLSSVWFMAQFFLKNSHLVQLEWRTTAHSWESSTLRPPSKTAVWRELLHVKEPPESNGHNDW